MGWHGRAKALLTDFVTVADWRCAAQENKSMRRKNEGKNLKAFLDLASRFIPFIFRIVKFYWEKFRPGMGLVIQVKPVF